MGTRQGTNKLPSHVALPHHHHNSISDFSIDSISLSFAGLVSVQDQQQQQSQISSVPNNQDEHLDHKLTKLPEPPFEFATTNKSDSNSASNNPINRITPADVLISNGKILPQALPSSQLSPNRSFISNNIPQRSLRTFLAGDNHHHHKSSKMMPSGKKTGNKADRKYYEPLGKERNEEIINSEKAEARTGFGQRVFKSFLAPCRECNAIQPGAVKCSREKN